MAGAPDIGFRRQLFGWLADHDEAYYDDDLRPYANVALLFSRQTLDYLDRGSWESDYAYHDEWRGMAMMLLESHIPYQVITEADLTAEKLADGSTELAEVYEALILPFFGAMSPAQAQAIRAYVAGGGTIVATGETSLFDAEGQQLPDLQLADVFGVSYDGADYEAVYVNDYGAGRSVFSLYPYPREYFWAAAPTWGGGNLAQAETIRQDFLASMWVPAGVTPIIATNAPRGVVVLPYRSPDCIVVQLVNYTGVGSGDPIPAPQSSITIGVALPPGWTITAAKRLDLLEDWQDQAFAQQDSNRVTATFDLDIHSVISFFRTYRIYLPLLLKGWKASGDQS